MIIVTELRSGRYITLEGLLVFGGLCLLGRINSVDVIATQMFPDGNRTPVGPD
jgi:hypothetical protein